MKTGSSDDWFALMYRIEHIEYDGFSQASWWKIPDYKPVKIIHEKGKVFARANISNCLNVVNEFRNSVYQTNILYLLASKLSYLKLPKPNNPLNTSLRR